MKTFKDLEFTEMVNDYNVNGKRARMMFDNGYGVSVVQSDMTYGGKEGLYELGVLDNPKGSVVLYTSVTNDVLGWLTEDEVTKHMAEVQELTRLMESFLSKEQITKLEGIEWDVIPNPAYIKLYQDELPSIVWVDLCETLGVDISVDHVRMLVIAKQVPIY